MRPLRRLQATQGRDDRLDGGPRQRSVAVDHDRQRRIDQLEAREQEVGLGRARLVPLVRLRGAREEIAKAVVLGVHPPTDDLNRWAYRAHVVDSSAALSARRVELPNLVGSELDQGGTKVLFDVCDRRSAGDRQQKRVSAAAATRARAARA